MLEVYGHVAFFILRWYIMSGRSRKEFSGTLDVSKFLERERVDLAG